MTAVIQVKRGTAAAWTSANTVLAAGEIGFETDTRKFKVGDGSTAWPSLSYMTVDLASASLTGIPTAPTANTGTNTTQIATTAFVTTAVNNVIDAAPGALDTLNELAAALGDDSNYATTVTNALATKASLTGSETLTNKTLTSPVINDSISNYTTLKSPSETFNIVASAATGTINIDLETSGAWYYTSNATANHTLNFRYNSGTTLSNKLSVGESVSFLWLNTNGSTPYYPNSIQVDGSSATVKWQGGTAPSAGNASSIDAYIFTVLKTSASPNYLVLGSQTKFA